MSVTPAPGAAKADPMPSARTIAGNVRSDLQVIVIPLRMFRQFLGVQPSKATLAVALCAPMSRQKRLLAFVCASVTVCNGRRRGLRRGSLPDIVRSMTAVTGHSDALVVLVEDDED